MSLDVFSLTSLPAPPCRLRPIKAAFEHLEKFLGEEIVAKKAELARDAKLDDAVSKANKNVFGRFVAASERERALGLGSGDIIGNLFVFLLAGVRSFGDVCPCARELADMRCSTRPPHILFS